MLSGPPTDEVMRATDEEAGGGSRYPSDDFRMCRICLEKDAPEDDPLIAPCRCDGSMKWVHRKCLDEWRAQEQVPLAFSHCPQCRFQYRTQIDEEGQRLKYIRLWLFVARDTCALLVLVQTSLAFLAWILHACDPGGTIVTAWDWANPYCSGNVTAGDDCWAKSHSVWFDFSFGPYYATTCIAFFAILGFVGLILTCQGRMPGQTQARHAPRRRPRSGSCCDGCVCPEVIYCSDPGIACPPDIACPRIEDGSDFAKKAAALLAVIALALLAFFVVMGLVFGLFFVVFFVQTKMQRHVRVLHMRGESKVHRVLDLADRPELLEEDQPRDSRPAYEGPAASLLVGSSGGSTSSSRIDS